MFTTGTLLYFTDDTSRTMSDVNWCKLIDHKLTQQRACVCVLVFECTLNIYILNLILILQWTEQCTKCMLQRQQTCDHCLCDDDEDVTVRQCISKQWTQKLTSYVKVRHYNTSELSVNASIAWWRWMQRHQRHWHRQLYSIVGTATCIHTHLYACFMSTGDVACWHRQNHHSVTSVYVVFVIHVASIHYMYKI